MQLTNIKITPQLVAKLREAGVECLISPGQLIPEDVVLEPPCSLKWLTVRHSYALGAFSYAVSGYAFAARVGRYTSIGEALQIRPDHPTDYLSTNPVFYRQELLFRVGESFDGGREFAVWRPTPFRRPPPSRLKITNIGNDVYVGHGAFIRPGVTVGDGAIVGAYSVVVKDVPPYAVVAGNPATVRKFRFPEKLIDALLELKWWRFAPWQLGGIDVSDREDAVKRLADIAPGLAPHEPKVIRLGEFARAERPQSESDVPGML